MRFRLSRRRVLLLAVIGVLCLPPLWIGAKLVKSGHASLWAPAYFRDQVAGRNSRADQTEDLIVVLCDHWEPGQGEKNIAAATTWLQQYKAIADRYHDSQGRVVQYSWFYPIDNQERRIMDELARAAFEGYGEVEVHWHHNHQDRDAYIADLEAGLQMFKATGALLSEPGGPLHWCFIHGNWALDGSVPGRCGIPDEITILQEHGCYADLTFPATGFAAQPRTINRIYRVQDTPAAKSYDTGTLVRAGEPAEGFLMLPGPLGLDFRNPLILIENAAIDDAEGSGFSGRIRPPKTYRDYFKASRIKLWDGIHVSVEGRPEWCFVKLHAHGMASWDELLGGEYDELFSQLGDYCQQRGIRLHYVTAREACNIVFAAERGLTGDPDPYRDLVIPPPLNRVQAMPAGTEGEPET